MNPATRFGMNKSDTIHPVTFYFRFDKTLIEREYLSNAASFSELDRLMGDRNVMARTQSFMIHVGTSPEGDPAYNKRLREKRAAAFKKFLIWKYPEIEQHKIKTVPFVADRMGMLKRMVEADPRVPDGEAAMHILEQNLPPDTRIRQLKELGGGRAWEYMTQHFFPYLRTGSVRIVLLHDPQEEPAQRALTESGREPSPVADPAPEPHIPAILQTEEEPFGYARPLALKTNLLFDLASVLNVEVELPLSPRWSLAGEWTFPWWLWESKQHCLQILSGSAELRYWWSPRHQKQDPSLYNHNPMTGWFAGVYAGGGLYDLEWDRKGYQGEFFIATGISAGYVTALSRNLNMEFSLGAGYLQTRYRHYEARQDNGGEWCLIEQYRGKYTWIGPTKARISLIWYPHFKKKKRAGL